MNGQNCGVMDWELCNSLNASSKKKLKSTLYFEVENLEIEQTNFHMNPLIQPNLDIKKSIL